MAYAIVSKPGAKFGPCVAECAHVDCEASRETAASTCVYCVEAIGYEREYCADDTGSSVHWVCAVEAAESQRKLQE